MPTSRAGRGWLSTDSNGTTTSTAAAVHIAVKCLAFDTEKREQTKGRERNPSL